MIIHRVEEGGWIGNVNGDGQLQLSSGRPDRIEAGIVNGNQIAALVPHFKTEWLPDFQALSAACRLLAQPFCCPIAEVVAMLRPLRPVDTAIDAKTLRRGGFEVVEVCLKDVLAPAAVEVDVDAHVRRVK